MQMRYQIPSKHSARLARVTDTPTKPECERDETPWRPGPFADSHPQGLPRGRHSLARTGAAFCCSACPFSTADQAEAAAHIAGLQFVVYRHEPP